MTEWIESDLPVPPGEFLAEELDARGMTARGLAEAIGRPPQAVHDILLSKEAITPRTAIELERVLGLPAVMWVTLQARYELAKARQELAGAASS